MGPDPIVVGLWRSQHAARSANKPKNRQPKQGTKVDPKCAKYYDEKETDSSQQLLLHSDKLFSTDFFHDFYSVAKDFALALGRRIGFRIGLHTPSDQ